VQAKNLQNLAAPKFIWIHHNVIAEGPLEDSLTLKLTASKIKKVKGK